MRSLLALFALFCGLACASPLAAKDCANAQCGGIIAPECLSRVGAGSLAVGAAAASTCPAQFDQYRSCLADVAARCDVRPAARTTEPEPVPRSAASPPPTGHSVAAVAAADGALFQFILSPAPLSWSAAEQIAAGMGGRLAIADTSDRRAVIASVLGRRPELFNRVQVIFSGWHYGPWIGGFQEAGAAEPDQGWMWSLDPSKAATAAMEGGPWLAQNPDNFSGAESFLHYFCIDQATCATWNDAPIDAPVFSYIVETPD